MVNVDFSDGVNTLSYTFKATSEDLQTQIQQRIANELPIYDKQLSVIPAPLTIDTTQFIGLQMQFDKATGVRQLGVMTTPKVVQ